MCWTTFIKTPKKLVAKEDVLVFKVCVKSLRANGTIVYSYFKYHSYDINKVYI